MFYYFLFTLEKINEKYYWKNIATVTEYEGSEMRAVLDEQVERGYAVWMIMTSKRDWLKDFSSIGNPLGTYWNDGKWNTGVMIVLPLAKE